MRVLDNPLSSMEVSHINVRTCAGYPSWVMITAERGSPSAQEERMLEA